MKHLVVLTGAGVSAESGIRTFRDTNGLWEEHRVEDVASPEGFARNPALVLEFYNQRRAQARTVQPNAAHLALAGFEEAPGWRVSIITQNVDDLHERAGSSQRAAPARQLEPDALGGRRHHDLRLSRRY